MFTLGYTAVLHIPYQMPEFDHLRKYEGYVVEVVGLEYEANLPPLRQKLEVEFIDDGGRITLYSDCLVRIITPIQYAKADWEADDGAIPPFIPGDRVQPATEHLILLDTDRNMMVDFGRITLFVVDECDASNITVHTLSNPHRTYRTLTDHFTKVKTHHDLKTHFV